MYRSSLFLLLPLVLVACSGGSDKGADDTGSASDDTGAGSSIDGAFAPQEGIWEGGDFKYDDACGLGLGDDSEDEQIRVTLTMDADGGGFIIVDEDEVDGDSEPMICTLDGQAFSCEIGEDDVEDTDFSEMGFDAVMTMDQTMGGDFSSATVGEIRMVIDVGCEGADCAEVAEMIEIDMPCTSSMSVPLLAG
jgi:hypothetical protein